MTQVAKAIIEVPHTQNFVVNGLGDHPAWQDVGQSFQAFPTMRFV